MKKLQQYFVFKFCSDRILKPLNLTIEDARANGELVSVGENQVIRLIKKKETDVAQISKLIKQKSKLSNSLENRQAIISLQEQIDNALFVPEYISVVIKNNKHYEKIIQNGFMVNGKKYVRLLCSAGNARNNVVIFIDSEIEQEIRQKINNGRDESVPLVPSKYCAYAALAASASYKVSSPRVAVIPDCIVKRVERVDFIYEDDRIEEKDEELEFNVFDGQGLICPAYAQQWAKELDLDYIPSAFCIRNSFVKGMVCVMDFHEYAKINGITHIETVYKTSAAIDEVDLILTASQFKLWHTYKSWQEYESNCKANGLHWGITKVTPDVEKDKMFLNYQFVQVLNLNKEQIYNLCKRTQDWIRNIVENIDDQVLPYLLGKLYETEDIDIASLSDNVTQALLANPKLINDSYVRKHIFHSLERKIKESYIGKLIVDGNFQVAISDPMALLEHIFGLPVRGYLKRGEFYSNYWIEQNVHKIAAMRAPLTWTSEINVVSLADKYEWFKHLNSGIIFNIHGADCMIHADSDFDMDIIASTNDLEVVNGATGGLPITYAKKSASKQMIIDSELYKADMMSFNSKIGFITNLSTTMYAMLEQFKDNNQYVTELINRLKLCRMHQGNAIDKAKGVQVSPLPNWNFRTGDYPELAIKQRPYFMRWLYPDYNHKYLKHRKKSDGYVRSHYKMSLEEFLASNSLTEEQQDYRNMYYSFNPLIESQCVMNIVSKHMEQFDAGIKELIKENGFDSLEYLVDKDIEIEPILLKKLEQLYNEFVNNKKLYKKIHLDDQKIQNYNQYCSFIRKKAHKITSNANELSSLAAFIVYSLSSHDKDFLWKVCNDGLISNILKNSNGENTDVCI